MVRASILAAIVLASTPARAGRWDACHDRLEDARLKYQGSVEEMPRWDFAEWAWSSTRDAVRLHYSWRDYDYELAVTATAEPPHGWRARWARGAWWFERVAHGRLASMRAMGTKGIRERGDLLRAFQPALDGCLK